MYKKLIMLIVVPALLPASVMAQTSLGSSNVIFYGKLDLALDLTRFSSVPGRAGQSIPYLSNDISYWGLTGTEDLGDGTRAYFKLESGFSMDTGASSGGSKLFDREAYVGYGAGWGALQLGSQFSPALFLQARSDAYARHGNGGGFTLTQQTPGNVRGFAGAGTLDNAIQYVSPRGKDFSFRFLHALSERATSPKDLGQYDSASLEYAKGPLFAGIAYEDQTLAGLNPNTTRSNRTLTAGLTYDFTVFKLFSYLMKNKLDGEKDVNAYQAGINYPIGVDTVRATYTTRRLEDTAGGRASTYALGFYHPLSIRTTLYASYAHLNNGSATNLGLWPSMKSYLPPVAAGGAGLPLGGQDVSSFEIGIRHTF
ncbi:porin [Herbaspirillum autotrophicum]|uniref:porin n=1 Tax=Herbaspirillum autotrophicum TaxID=180195 RepID=UPI00067C9BB8|nr:porin [Herbaspirillum autotrophicum]